MDPPPEGRGVVDVVAVVDLEGGVVDAVAVVEERLELAADAVGSRRRGGRARVR